MSVILVEGFESVDPGYDITAERLQKLFVAMEPDHSAGWFGGAGDSVQTFADGRIAGNCLRLSRGSGTGVSWARKYAATIGFSFIPKQAACLGFAVKYSAQPTEAIPLAVMRYDDGTGSAEQLGIWATSDGRVFASLADFDADYDLQSIASNPLAMSEAGAIRFSYWTYLEFQISYADTTPILSIAVNGTIVLENIESETLRNNPDNYLSSIHVVNPSNAPFGGAYSQYIDDMYITDGDMLGPQWVAKLSNGAATSNTGWTGVPGDNYPNFSVTAESWDDAVSFQLSDPVAGIGTVNAIAVTVIAEQSIGIDAITYGVRGTSTALTKKSSFTMNEGIKAVRYVTDSAPLGTTMTGTGLAGLRGHLVASKVVF